MLCVISSVLESRLIYNSYFILYNNKCSFHTIVFPLTGSASIPSGPRSSPCVSSQLFPGDRKHVEAELRGVDHHNAKDMAMNKFWKRNIGFVFLALAIISAGMINGCMSRPAAPPAAPGVNINYQLPPGGWQSLPPTQTQTVVQTPAATPLYQGGTTVHNYAPAPAATPVQFVSHGFRSSKQDAWTHENAGFQISSPANGRDAVNANSTANAWRAQQNVSEQRSQDAAAKETPPKIVTKVVTVPVVKTVTVPVYVDRTIYVHPRYWVTSPSCSN